MGYISHYDFGAKKGSIDKREEVKKYLIKNKYDYGEMVLTLGLIESGTQYDKWYQYDYDMVRLSKVFPEYIFTLWIYGEQDSDIRKNYYKNGLLKINQAKLPQKLQMRYNELKKMWRDNGYDYFDGSDEDQEEYHSFYNDNYFEVYFPQNNGRGLKPLDYYYTEDDIEDFKQDSKYHFFMSDQEMKEKLLEAAVRKDFAIVRNMIEEEEVDLNTTDGSGCTALFLDSKNGSIRIVDYLISKGAEINHTNDLDKNALFPASENDYIDIAEHLIEAEINIQHTDNLGNNALFYADMCNAKDAVDCLERLNN